MYNPKEFETIEVKDKIYLLCYFLNKGNVCPSIIVYKNIGQECTYNNNLICNGYYCNGIFQFYDNSKDKGLGGFVTTMDNLFKELRLIVGIPKEVKEKYEKYFLLYKLNNFKEF